MSHHRILHSKTVRGLLGFKNSCTTHNMVWITSWNKQLSHEITIINITSNNHVPYNQDINLALNRPHKYVTNKVSLSFAVKFKQLPHAPFNVVDN